MTDARRKTKILLLERRMTMADLADRSGLAEATIHNVLNGASSRKSKQAITNALGGEIWEGIVPTERPFTLPIGMEIDCGTSGGAEKTAAQFATEFGPGRAVAVGTTVRVLKPTPAVLRIPR